MLAYNEAKLADPCFFIQTVLGAKLEQCVIWVGRDQWRQEKGREREAV